MNTGHYGYRSLVALLLATFTTLLLAPGLSRAATTTLYFIHTDPAGSIIGRTNAAGNVNWRETYTPYGERVVDSAGAVNNRLFFHGKAFDPDTELVYFGARYYDPFVGRFMGMDRELFDERNAHSFNLYAYGNNNPYKYRDPDGRMPNPLFLIEVAKHTGAGYAMGVAADAVSQAMAFGEVNWSMAATSSAAAAGGAAGLLAGLFPASSGARALSSGERSIGAAVRIEEGNARHGLEHIMRRHAFESTAKDVSRFSQGIGRSDIKAIIQEAEAAKEHGASKGQVESEKSTWEERLEPIQPAIQRIGSGQ